MGHGRKTHVPGARERWPRGGRVSDTQRITVRVPVRDVEFMDALVETGEYTSRTAVVRRAIRDFIKERGPEMAEAAESEQAFTEALTQLQQMQEQLEMQREILEQQVRE